MKDQFQTLMKEQFQRFEKRHSDEIERMKKEHSQERKKYENAIEKLMIEIEKHTEQIGAMELYIKIEDKSIRSDLTFLKDDKEMLNKYVNFLNREHYFERGAISSCGSGSWIYENDTDVVLVWFVRNFCEKIEAGEQTLSPHITVGKKGYNVKAFTKFSGVEEGDLYLSIYLRVVAGCFDASLKWPFRQPYELTVLNWQNSEETRIRYISKEQLEEKKLFENTLKTTGYGYPRHTMLKDIETVPGFVINDAIIIKVSVKKFQT